jgi:hypothetical protein
MIQHHRLIRDPSRTKVRRIIREMLASKPAPATSCGKGDRLKRGYNLGYDAALKLLYRRMGK